MKYFLNLKAAVFHKFDIKTIATNKSRVMICENLKWLKNLFGISRIIDILNAFILSQGSNRHEPKKIGRKHNRLSLHIQFRYAAFGE